MIIELLREICLSFPQVTEDIKWEDHLCFNIGGKMFLITSPDQVPVSASFKASDEAFAELITREGFKPAPYLARHKWVAVDDLNRFTKSEWEHYSRQSYALILAKLPAKIRNQVLKGEPL